MPVGRVVYKGVVRGGKNGRVGLAKQEEWNKQAGRRVKRSGLTLGLGHVGGRLLGLGGRKA